MCDKRFMPKNRSKVGENVTINRCISTLISFSAFKKSLKRYYIAKFLDYSYFYAFWVQIFEAQLIETRKDMALSAISMNSALADKQFVLSLHHKLHVSTCINKPNDVHKYNQSIIHSINQLFFYINNNETSLRDETISR